MNPPTPSPLQPPPAVDTFPSPSPLRKLPFTSHPSSLPALHRNRKHKGIAHLTKLLYRKFKRTACSVSSVGLWPMHCLDMAFSAQNSAGAKSDLTALHVPKVPFHSDASLLSTHLLEFPSFDQYHAYYPCTGGKTPEEDTIVNSQPNMQEHYYPRHGYRPEEYTECNKENMPPLRYDWRPLQERKKKKKKRKRSWMTSRVNHQKQIAYRKGETLLAANDKDLEMELTSSTRGKHSKDGIPLQNSGGRKIPKETSLPAHGSKQALVKSLLEKYLKNRKLRTSKNQPSISPGYSLLFFSSKPARMVECFSCKTYIEASDLAFCSYKSCRRAYHVTCAQGLKDFVFRKNGDLVCPQHICMTCKSLNKTKILRCERCLFAAHKKCLAFPEHVRFFSDTPDCIICWKHPKDWRLENKHKAPSNLPKEAFARLPIPYAPVEFSIKSKSEEEISETELRPNPYVQIRRNLFLVKRKKDDADDEIGCSCRDSCEDSCVCRAQSSSCSKRCCCDETCRNKPFRKDKKIRIVKTLACGWGAQAAKPIAKGEFIIEYVGEVINDAICEERLWTMKERGEHNFYMCEIERNFIIDATFKGNASRFVNHSCYPNCVLEKWRVDGEIRVGIFAVRDIKEGEDLSYDYKFVQFGPRVKCCCGASNCRGYLGEPYQNKKVKPSISDATVVSKQDHFPTWGERQKRTRKPHSVQPLDLHGSLSVTNRTF